MFQHSLNACRCAGDRAGFLKHKAPQVDRVEPVGVLVGIHRQKSGVEIESFWNRMLNDEGVNFRVVVKIIDRFQ